ncbi:nuclear factor NF-kappa-B p105 subunit-like [Limulus polyphemus]|uniref:Nuclear factor NF-kappa-B p105 subunit-like n=1 Tax=Limulus polyphemus TaxID=6850 RepID=A0ABM1AZS4_LIMPO|nr:nuclear factor NF-kappa-B p105 subunit-like [Limulus polyphemus]
MYSLIQLFRGPERTEQDQPTTENQAILKIIEQPTNSIRYRYKSEKGSHGGLTGKSSTTSNKTYPTVKIENFQPQHNQQVYVKATLYSVGDEQKPHVHKLMGKDCDSEGTCNMKLNSNGTARLEKTFIQHVGKEGAIQALGARKTKENCWHHDTQKCKLREDVEQEAKDMDLNRVRICFMAFVRNPACPGYCQPLCQPVFSDIIANQKCPDVGELKITRISKYTGFCTGNEEVFLLCEKVNKKDIKIRFFEEDREGNILWEGCGDFSENDVHHQVAIVFRTPAYKDRNIKEDVNVKIQLYRQKDNHCSGNIDFLYTPAEYDREEVKRKRQKISGFQELHEPHDLGLLLQTGASSSGSSWSDTSTLGSFVGHSQCSGSNREEQVTSMYTMDILNKACMEIGLVKNPITKISSNPVFSEIQGQSKSFDSNLEVQSTSFNIPNNDWLKNGLGEGSILDYPFSPVSFEVQFDPDSLLNQVESDSVTTSGVDSDIQRYLECKVQDLTLNEKISEEVKDEQRQNYVPSHLQKNVPQDVNHFYTQSKECIKGSVEIGLVPVENKVKLIPEHIMKQKPKLDPVPLMTIDNSNSYNSKQAIHITKQESSSETRRAETEGPEEGTDMSNLAENIIKQQQYAEDEKQEKNVNISLEKFITQSVEPTGEDVEASEKRQHRHSIKIEDKNSEKIPLPSGLPAVKQLALRMSLALRAFVVTGDLRILLITLRHLVAVQDEEGDNALHLTIIHQAKQHVQQLALIHCLLHVLEGLPGQVINQCNNLHQTPLFLAVVTGSYKAIPPLLLNGADLNVADNEGNTPVHVAVKKGDDTALTLLLERNNCSQHISPVVNLNKLNYEGFAPLHLAVLYNRERCIDRLCESGANVNIADGTSGNTALHLAVEHQPHLVRGLLKKNDVDIDAQNFSGNTALHLACTRGLRNIVIALMEADANPLIQNFDMTSCSSQCGCESLEGDITCNNHEGKTAVDLVEDNFEFKQILAGEIKYPPQRSPQQMSSSLTELRNDGSFPTVNPEVTKFDYMRKQQVFFDSAKVDCAQQLKMFDSGYASGEIHEMKDKKLEVLCAELDKDNQWKSLGPFLGFDEHMLTSIEKFCHKNRSPSKDIIEKFQKNIKAQEEKSSPGIADDEALKNALKLAGLEKILEKYERAETESAVF